MPRLFTDAEAFAFTYLEPNIMRSLFGLLLRPFIAILVAWRTEEVRKHEARVAEVRERNRKRRRELDGSANRTASEDAWREGPTERSEGDDPQEQADKRLKRRLQNWSPEPMPAKSFGLIASTIAPYAVLGGIILCSCCSPLLCIGVGTQFGYFGPGGQKPQPTNQSAPRPPAVAPVRMPPFPSRK